MALIARTKRQINHVGEEIRQLGRRCLAVVADVSDEKEISNSFKHINDSLGPIDILVNNAGIKFNNPFSEMPLEEWDRTMNVNARGVVICTKAVLPDMLKRNEGSIINIASGAGLRGLPGSAAYGASKAAIIALSFALADEVRDRGVRVNVICPGPIKTDMIANDPFAKNGLNVLLPDDVAGTAVFIASKLSGKITGQVLNVRNSNRW